MACQVADFCFQSFLHIDGMLCCALQVIKERTWRKQAQMIMEEHGLEGPGFPMPAIQLPPSFTPDSPCDHDSPLGSHAHCQGSREASPDGEFGGFGIVWCEGPPAPITPPSLIEREAVPLLRPDELRSCLSKLTQQQQQQKEQQESLCI